MEDGRSWIAKLAMRDSWLSLRKEEIVLPELPIIDPHHHLWNRKGYSYQIEELLRDISCGHNIKQTVYIECGAFYRKEGPEVFRSVGEVEYISELIRGNQLGMNSPDECRIGGIVSRIDLRSSNVLDIIKLHIEKSQGNLRGVRHSAAFMEDSLPLTIPGYGPEGLYLDADYQNGARALRKFNLVLDCWHYFSQRSEFIKFLDVVQDTTVVLNHLGTPLGIGSSRYFGDFFDEWKRFIEALGKKKNVYLKLGGLGMVDLGWGLHTRREPIGSEEYARLVKPLVIHAIECFGSKRCMFQSNFPVDRVSISYQVLWNAFKIICKELDYRMKAELFSETARLVYKL